MWLNNHKKTLKIYLNLRLRMKYFIIIFFCLWKIIIIWNIPGCCLIFKNMKSNNFFRNRIVRPFRRTSLVYTNANWLSVRVFFAKTIDFIRKQIIIIFRWPCFLFVLIVVLWLGHRATSHHKIFRSRKKKHVSFSINIIVIFFNVKSVRA